MISPSELERLQAYLDGELSSADCEAVEAQLKNDAALADALITLAQEEAVFAEWAQTGAKTHQITARFETNRRETLPFVRQLRRIAGVAALLMIAVGLSYWLRSSTSASVPVLAKLEHVLGQVSVTQAGVRRTASSGTKLFAGESLELTGDESSAVVVYADGTRLQLDGDTIITELSGGETTGKRVVLASGDLRADVAKQPPGRPMVLITPKAEVVVLGTRFGLSGGVETTYVETEEGAVRMTRKSDGRSVEIPAGFEGIAGGDDAGFAPLASPPRFHQPRFTTAGNHLTTAFSPDGLTLVTSRFGRGEVVLWNATDMRERLTIAAHPSAVIAAVLSAYGRKLATAGAEQTIKVWDVETGNLLATLDGPPRLLSMAFAEDDAVLHVLAGHSQQEKTLESWDLTTWKKRPGSQPHLGERWAFSPSGRLLATASSRNPSVTVWDIATGRQVAECGPFPARLLCMAFSPDEARLAASDMTGRVTLWNLATFELQFTFRPAGQTVQGLAFSPDGTRLAMGQRYATVRLWDIATGKQQAILEGPTKPGSTASVRPMFFSFDGKTLATTESLDDSTVRLWDVPLN